MHKLTYKNIRSRLNFKFQANFFLKQLTFDTALLLSIYSLFKTPYAVINIFLIPALMIRQFSILHEAVHGLSHPSKKINQLIGTISGAFCLTPYAAWKAAHLQHHYWTGNLSQDPTFAILKTFEKNSDSKKRLIELTWNKGIPLLAFLQHLGFWVYSFKTKSFTKSLTSHALPISIYAAALTQINLQSALIGFIGVGLYLRIYEEMIIPQHVGMYSDDSIDYHPSPWEQPNITRSWYLNPILEKHVVLNMNYHTEHHLFPDLPWHQLKQAHKLLIEEKEDLNIISLNWMSQQRQRPFGEVIIPVPSPKNKAA